MSVVVFLHGKAACGKLTVGRALAARTGYPLFHNHLIVDAVSAVFPFGSEAFVALRQRFWLDMFSEAARLGRPLIFTFAPADRPGTRYRSNVRRDRRR